MSFFRFILLLSKAFLGARELRNVTQLLVPHSLVVENSGNHASQNLTRIFELPIVCCEFLAVKRH